MFDFNVNAQNLLRKQITLNYRIDEGHCIDYLFKILASDDGNSLLSDIDHQARELAAQLITKVRKVRVKGRGVDAIMQEFKLSTEEGVALMCLAESLLRIPDKATQDKLIRDKVTKGDWGSFTKTGNMFINATSWGLLITGKLVGSFNSRKLSTVLLKILAKGGEPLIRKSVEIAVRFMGNQFVMSEDIKSALKIAPDKEKLGYQFSYDMLGEAAMNDEDAVKYMQSYVDAIDAIGVASANRGIHKGPGISVKLSAIYPRYQRSQYHKVIKHLYPRLKQLYLLAKKYQVGLFIDAEESERLEISLDLLEMLATDKDLSGFDGIGFVVQAYQKRAPYVIDFIADLAKRSSKRLMLRLVKGAYWDSEIKRAQVEGQRDYPVFTRKFYTDLSYIACAKKLLQCQQQIYPLFATHNAYTLATIYQMAKGKQFEFQCLYGMGEALYDNVVGAANLDVTCRVYAPVGTHETLLAYLVRRLLENGANSSFVYQIVDNNIPIDNLLVNPIMLAQKACGKSNPYFSLPIHIYPDGRINSRTIDINNELELYHLEQQLNYFATKKYTAYSLIASQCNNSIPHGIASTSVINPANCNDIIGTVTQCGSNEVNEAFASSKKAFLSWSHTAIKDRAAFLLSVADKLEQNYYEILGLLVREAGKTLSNAISEVREAVDFCRYYAQIAVSQFSDATHKALGIIVCISPWNFPLAIFIGEVSSALVCGNTVITKPSYQTNLIAFYVVNLFYSVGVPRDVLQLIIGQGSAVGNLLTRHKDVSGVIFTGSTDVARVINQNLSFNSNRSILIAETGGQNSMIVDSSSLPEQVVNDVVNSAFDSAGQRCSALRVLYLQEDIADKVLHMLKGNMATLQVADPAHLSTDVGPIIDKVSCQYLLDHIEKMRSLGKKIYQSQLSDKCEYGYFVAPTLIEIDSIRELKQEVFGPIVHVIRFRSKNLDKVIKEINTSGYGLTQGVHSRIESTIKKVYENIKAGNIYINRNMVGAVVGVQPFGGEGLSGTGPKAGGPFYLYRLVTTNCQPKLDFKVTQRKLTALDSFINKIAQLQFSLPDQEELKIYAKHVIQDTLINKHIELPGPTGEYNFMFFARRGNVACIASNKFEYAKQIICTLATTNVAVLNKNEITLAFSGILPRHIILVENNANIHDLNAALIARSRAHDLAAIQLFAKREGCLVVTIYETDIGYYDLHLLTVERTVSNNITATGGNVELMSIVDDV